MLAAYAAVLVCPVAARADASTLSLSAISATLPGGGTETISVGGSVVTPNARLELVAEPAANVCAASFNAAFESMSSSVTPVITNVEGALEQGPLNQSVPLGIELAPRYEAGGGSPSSTLIAAPGEYRVCGYLEESNFRNEAEVLTSATTTFTVRVPDDSITLAPSFRSATERYTVPVGYQIEPGTTPVQIGVGLYPTFSIEGENFNCSHPELFKWFEPAPGSGTLRFTVEHGSPGVYGLCVRVLNRPLPTLELARASMTITVGSSSHPSSGGGACVVPGLAGKTLRHARTALARAHCRLGRVTHRHRRGHRRGTVISQSVSPGKRLKAGASVNVVLAR